MKDFRRWIMEDLASMYRQTVADHPNTIKRQHLIDDVEVKDVQFIPGPRSLVVRANTNSKGKPDSYQTSIGFEGVKYMEEKPQDLTDYVGTFRFTDSRGQSHMIEKVGVSGTTAKVDCTCADFRSKFMTGNRAAGGLLSGTPAAAVAPAGGFGMCKHIMGLAKQLKREGLTSPTPPIRDTNIDALRH